MEVLARARYVRRAPRKARLVADTVRGLRVVDALAQLEFSPRHAAVDVAKAIKSAAANAEHNHQLARDQLWLKQVLVDEGPTMKRVRPVSRGMAHQYFHRTCHITAIVEDRPEAEPVRRQLVRRATARPAPAGRAAGEAPAAAAAEPEFTTDFESEESGAPAKPASQRGPSEGDS
jgi:large subunit ribosomal protein L22